MPHGKSAKEGVVAMLASLRWQKPPLQEDKQSEEQGTTGISAVTACGQRKT
jgi:hypothetical protein